MYQEDKDLKILVDKYHDTKDNKYLEEIYNILPRFVKAILLKYYQKVFVDAGFNIEELADEISVNLIIDIIDKNKRVFAWGKYLRLYIKKYLPSNDRYLKRHSELLSEDIFNDMEGDSKVNREVKEEYAKEDREKEFNLLLNQIIKKHIKQCKELNILKNEVIFKMLLYMSMWKLNRCGLKMQEIKPKRIGFLLSLWCTNFYELVGQELKK